jgi:hypothetical protein
VYETYSFYKQVIGLFALTLEAMDIILPNKIQLFFRLFGLKKLKYLLKVEERLVTYFMNPKLIEPLLMVFSFDIIKDDISLLVTHFSGYFAKKLQSGTTLKSRYLVDEVFRNKNFSNE